jgi:putative Mg2+ transporter-C (MgtC) family protein
MACGAGLPILALAVTAGHFIIVFAFPQIARRLPRAEFSSTQLRLTYEGGQGVLRRALSIAGRRGFSVSEVSVEKQADTTENVVSVELTVQGVGDPKALAAELGELGGALSVHSSDVDDAVDHV